MVLDTGVMLLHAMKTYQDGRHLFAVSGDIPHEQTISVATEVDQLLRGFRCFTTPQVLAEFQGLAQRQARLKPPQLGDFLLEHSRFPMGELYVPFYQLVETKSKADAWPFSYTDTSVVLAAKGQEAVVLTTDRALRRLGNRLGVQVLHIYEDFYLYL